MATYSPNSSFNEILSTTLNRYIPDLKNSVFNGVPTLAALTKLGVRVRTQGGASLVVPTNFQQGSAAWMAFGGELNPVAVSQPTAAQYNWCLLADSVTVFDGDVKMNQGDTQVIDLVKTKIEILTRGLKQKFNSALFSDGSNALQPAGLQAIASTSNPSAGNLGGIDRTTNSLWKGFVNDTAQALTFTDLASGHSGCSYDGLMPDLIVMPQDLFDAYESLAAAKRLIMTTDVGNLGFDELQFRNAKVIWDRDCPAGDVFFLTSELFRIYNMDGADFTVLPPVRPVNQLMDVHMITWYGQFVAFAPRHFGVLKSRTA